MTGERDRLPRLLALVPYLQARPGVSVAEAARAFDIGEDQLRRDLQLLWMCGLPGHGPGDLIDLSFEGETVSVVFDAGMSRPLRLTSEEALALAVALRTLAETPGLDDRDAVERALAKVETAAGGAWDAALPVSVELDETARWLPAIQQALSAGRALRLVYYTAARDETTDRVVDPLRLFEVDGRGYLEAWCRRAEGLRVFRIDRIQSATVLDEPARPPEGLQLRDEDELARGVYSPAPEHLSVVLRLGAAYAWVADYYVSDEVSDDASGAGSRLATMRVSDPSWVRALVLGSDGQVSVLSPDWLAESIREHARTALAAYGD